MLRRFIALVPVLAALIFILSAIALRDRLPDPLAIHFGISGTADGFMGFWPAVLLNASLILIPAMIALLFGRGLRDKGLTGIFLWLPIGFTALFFMISAYLLIIQLDLQAGEVASLNANFFLLLFLPLIVLLPLLLTKPKVDVGEDQLTISSLGIPLARVPFLDVEQVGIEELKASEFGCWGLRMNLAGDVAFLPSSGPALAVTRRHGNKILIRSDEAEKLKSQIERKLS